MGANTIIILNQASVDRKSSRKASTFKASKQPINFKRQVIDQLIWLATLVLLMDMALKNKRKRLTAWWAK